MEGGSMRLFLALALVAGMALIEVAPAAAAPPGSDQDVFAVGDAAVLGRVHVHRGSFTCDGKRHVAWYTVDTVEEGTRGQLQSGWGYVQFCITTDEDLISIRQQWSRVVTNG
jgi:hypothetical protein